MLRLTDFNLLTQEQQKELVLADNGPRAQYPDHRTIAQLFAEQAARTPENAALVCGGRSLTYAELDRQANRIAHCLRQTYGVGAGQVVGLLMDRTEPLVVALLGVLKAGAAYLPIDPDNPAERVGYLLADAAARLCIVNGDAAAHLAYRTGDTPMVPFATLESEAAGLPDGGLPTAGGPDDLVYVIYTSGSTGLPKGVAVAHRNLVNYTCWANEYYFGNRPGYPFPLFTSIAFDLTCTSLFTTLLRGDAVLLHPEKDLYEVLGRIFGPHSEAKVVKLTPSHISILSYLPLTCTGVTCAIVGGEALTPGQVKTLKRLNPAMRVFNEYGPTEATVGCTIKEVGEHDQVITIGRPIANTGICLLDESLNVLPRGAVGEIWVAGNGVAAGYLNNRPLTEQRFVTHPVAGRRMYRTGDLGRWLPDGDLELLGRKDMQVKLNGYRVELEEVESVLGTHPGVVACVADVRAVGQPGPAPAPETACTRCGIAANYPGIRFDGQGVCNMCRSYEAYKDKAQAYFKETGELRRLLAEVKAARRGEYDCLMLYSGGKDSTYVLCQLVKEFGLRVLAFSFDNGYISEQAKANIRRVTDALGVDLVFGTSPHMNEIFVDSLQRHSNVCNGCFKTIYTLGLQTARERNIDCVVTGLSRGQLYETRLYQLFGSAVFDPEQVDRNILEARKTYHRLDDAVSRCLDVEMFRDGRIFDQVRIVDFFRYTDVELKEMYNYLDQHVPWVRPSDTGRSTNCRINDLGIYVHKRERGYHNYALPYSWDVRMGHKTRDEAMDELNDRIDVPAVRQMMDEIGYREGAAAPEATKQLVAYYVAPQPLEPAALQHFLARKLPHYMIPTAFVRLDALPLTLNGKVNRQLLPALTEEQRLAGEAYEPPRTETEEALAASWREVLQIGKVGIHHNFFTLGGSSIKIVMLYERLEARFPGVLKVSHLFDNPTIAAQARLVERPLSGGDPVPGAVYDVLEL